MSILERGLAFQVLSLHSTAIPAEGPGLRIWRGQRKGLGGGWGGRMGKREGEKVQALFRSLSSIINQLNSTVNF